ncbi:hypothetical protein TrST_g12361 [Triparma strigata]|nr:hypothetical protein TrST_g12361 [Triparma strigata]
MVDDGFTLCDLSTIPRKLASFNESFRGRVTPFFAVKCHPDDQVLRELTSSTSIPCGFDCASMEEIRAVDPDSSLKIIYANPQKSKQGIEYSLACNVYNMTFDSSHELLKVATVARQQKDRKKIFMILRLLVPDGDSKVPLGEKFGAPPEKALALYNQMREDYDDVLELIGISFHVGSGAHDPSSYKSAIFIARDVLLSLNAAVDRDNASMRNGSSNYKKLWLLDIGGGFPGFDGGGADEDRFDMSVVPNPAPSSPPIVPPSTLTTKQIADAIYPAIESIASNDGFTVVAEPGRFFVEAAFALCCRVYCVEFSKDSPTTAIYYISQGVDGVFKDVKLCNEIFTPAALRVEEEGNGSDSFFSDSSDLVSVTIRGPSGAVNDAVRRDVLLPRLCAGDWLVFDRMGAYTTSIAGLGSKSPKIYMKS